MNMRKILFKSHNKRYKYQHNKNIVSMDSYLYLYNYKMQLLDNINKLFGDLDIKYVISHGNLIEYERGERIFHDDDLDIRVDSSDLHKWKRFCSVSNRKIEKYNLVFDDRFKNIEKQLFNGIQVSLIKFYNKFNIKEFEMNIHADVVLNKVTSDFWADYDIDYSNLRAVDYFGVKTYAPSKDDTKNVLSKQYGESYLIPKVKNNINTEKNVITFGTFDLFHIGHLNIIRYCKDNFPDFRLIVGVSSDGLNFRKKNKYPIINQEQRMDIVKNIKGVSEVFLEESLEEKLNYCLKYNASILVMGDDHKGRFDFLKAHLINVIYKPRTKNIASELIELAIT